MTVYVLVTTYNGEAEVEVYLSEMEAIAAAEAYQEECIEDAYTDIDEVMRTNGVIFYAAEDDGPECRVLKRELKSSAVDDPESYARVMEALEAAREVYRYSSVGGNLHVQLDDGNLDDGFWDRKDWEREDNPAEARCRALMAALNLRERVAVYESLWMK